MSDKVLYKVAPEAMMRLIQAAMTILDLDNYKKKNDPLAGMSNQGRVELAFAISEGNMYLTSVKEILDEVAGEEEDEPSTESSLILT